MPSLLTVETPKLSCNACRKFQCLVEGKKKRSAEGFPNPWVFLCAWESCCAWEGGFLQCVFSHGKSQTPGGEQRCFPVRALPHLSMLLGLWHRRLRWCPQGCFTGVSYFCPWKCKGKALPSCHLPLYPILLPAVHGGAQERLFLFFCPFWVQQGRSTPIPSLLVSRGMFPF